jgi:1-phosphofructokinase
MILTVTPNPSLDCTLCIAGLTRGQVHRAVRQFYEPSGKGVNVARALTRNRLGAHAVLPLGGTAGDQLRSLLRQEGVLFTGVPIGGAVRTNVSLSEPDGTATKVNTVGPTLTAEEVSSLLGALERQAANATWVVGSGSLPGGVPEDFYAEVGRLAHRAGARFALDSSGAAFLAGLAARPDLVKPNVDELREATGAPVETVADVARAAEALQVAGARTVVVSLGPDGALLKDGDTVVHAAADAPIVESTVGAGDALLAGLLAASRGLDDSPAETLREAVAWATAAVGVEGSHVPLVTAGHRALVRVGLPPAAHRPLHPRPRPGQPQG